MTDNPLAGAIGILRGQLWGILLWAIIFTAIIIGLNRCQEVPVPAVNRIVSEKVSRHQYHGIQVSWKYRGVWYFTRDEKDFKNKEKWVGI